MANLNEELADSILMINAVQANDGIVLRQLLEKKQTQANLDTSLCWASRLGHYCLVVMLIDYGASPGSEVWGGFTPLLWATIFAGDLNVIHYLIKCGGNVNHCSNKRKQTPLHAAVIKGDHLVAQALIDAGANLDHQDYLNKTPLLHAVQRNLQECVKTLILNNCNVNLPGFVNGSRLSPLLVALLQNNLEITKMLILAGARFEQMAIYQTYTLRQFYRTVEDNLNFEIRPVYLKQQCRKCF
ncbi:ANR17-like protein [Mya arenaria]|uniref:ANR17-like protein n=1 Tax=Mya arenaria TaxID=6604 RepID=A0ABY7EL46_MYAAR|nr:ANR17-like protein [Mya arenaria]